MNRIKEVLEEKGIKQKWLAEKLGKSYNMVNGYVQNRQQPKLEILFEIAEILEVKPKDFQAWYDLAHLYAAIQDWPNAALAFKKALDLNPADQKLMTEYQQAINKIEK